MKRYDLELTATGPVMEESKEGAFVPFSEVSGLADTVMKMSGRCQLLADLLREVTQIVPAIGVAIDDLPAVDAFLERIEAALAGQALERIGSNALAMMMDELHDICVGLEAPGGAQNGAEAWEQVKEARDRVLASLNQGRPDTEWTDTATSPVSADYRELQAQHDQLQSKHKGALDLLHELREGAEIHLHNCNVCKNEEGVNNWTGKLARIDAALTGHVVSPPLRLLIQMTDILKMCRSALITAYEDTLDATAKGVIQYRIKLATKGINMAEHAIDAAAQANSGRFITEGQELELITVLQSIVNGFSDDPAHDAAALLKRITGEVPWTGDSFQLPPSQGGESCALEPRSSSPA
ncbi:hypothetical protein NUK42_02240 [Aeromonas veronii]|uniref:hypothetical protein n=1 Tax=Aeromonas veronii TaxID=654 RepID=UPI00214F32B8|nr:hypothetical protein [Aeromonas veronii]MCR3957568.1 hypothetical protein [Aeromonas veronii]